MGKRQLHKYKGFSLAFSESFWASYSRWFTTCTLRTTSNDQLQFIRINRLRPSRNSPLQTSDPTPVVMRLQSKNKANI